MRAQAEKDSAADEQRIKASVEEEKQKILAAAEQEIAAATTQAQRQIAAVCGGVGDRAGGEEAGGIGGDGPVAGAGICTAAGGRRFEGRAELMSVVSLRYAHAFASVAEAQQSGCRRGAAAAGGLCARRWRRAASCARC